MDHDKNKAPELRQVENFHFGCVPFRVVFKCANILKEHIQSKLLSLKCKLWNDIESKLLSNTGSLFGSQPRE